MSVRHKAYLDHKPLTNKPMEPEDLQSFFQCLRSHQQLLGLQHAGKPEEVKGEAGLDKVGVLRRVGFITNALAPAFLLN